MNAIVARLKNHFARWREWELNPVVVKELRQSVRSWAVTGMVLLFLAVLFCTALAFLVSQSFQATMDQQLGANVFRGFLVILTGASLCFIPLYVGIRVAVERQESNLDLLYITTLTPARIIRGKFFCGAYMTLLFFSACMPFMVFTNLLRGVDLPTIFFVLACLFLVICAAIQVAIFLACLPISRAFKVIVGLFAFISVFFLIGPLVYFFFEMMYSGVGSMLVAGRDFWAGFFTAVGLILAGVVLLYYLSVALVSPPSANRALPVRTYLTILWLAGGGICGFWMMNQHDVRFMLPWAIVSLLVLAVALIVVVSNNDELSFRVRRKIPAAPLKRAVAFLFYNGAAGGLTWIVLLAGTTYYVTRAFLHMPNPGSAAFGNLDPEQRRDFEIMTGAVVLYSLSYALAALFIHRQFIGRRSPRLAGVLAILIPAAWALVPNLVYFFLNRLSWKSVEESQLGNMFNVFIVKESSQKLAHVVCAAILLLLMLALNAKWFVRQLQHFRPLDRSAPPPKLAATAAPLSTAVE
jgi:hypothetical protein